MALPANIDTPQKLTQWVAAHYAGPQRASVYAQFLPQVRQRMAAPIMPAYASKFTGGAAAKSGATAGTAAGSTQGSTTATPATPPAPARSYGQEAGIQGTQDQINAQPGIYNPKRLSIFAEGARSLTDQGLYDTAQVGQRTAQQDGTITYGIDAGPNGQAYRNAANNVAAANNARGTLFGSAAREQQATAANALNNQRDAYLRGLASQQDTTLADQAQQTRTLSSQLASQRGDYTDWQAQQPVPAPTAQDAVSTAAAAPQPTKTYAEFLAGRKSTEALARQWDRLYNGSRRFG